MRVGLGRVEPDRLPEMADGLVGILLRGEQDPQVQMSEPDAAIQRQRASQVRFGRPAPSPCAFPRRPGRSRPARAVADWPVPLRTPGGLLVALLLPIQITQPEVGVGWHGRCFYRGLELRRRGLRPVGGVERLAQKDVNRRGIRVFRKQKLEFAQGFRILLPTTSSSAPGCTGAPRCPAAPRRRVSIAPRRPGTARSRSSSSREGREPGNCRYRPALLLRMPRSPRGDGWI